MPQTLHKTTKLVGPLSFWNTNTNSSDQLVAGTRTDLDFATNVFEEGANHGCKDLRRKKREEGKRREREGGKQTDRGRGGGAREARATRSSGRAGS